jgi:hypothetical protein
MDHRMPNVGPDGERIVYIRSVPATDLPEAARGHAPSGPIYAIHDSDGNRLAFVADRRLAFVVARQNDLSPVSVH